MRIGVLTTSYPRQADDPAGAFVAGFARWLASHVGEVEVLCADESRPIFYRGGAPGALRGRGWWHAARFSTRLLAEVARRSRRWDAIVSHWLVPSGAIGLLLQGSRPHLAIAHGSDVRLLARLPGGHALLRQLSRRADLVYVAEALAVPGAPGRVVPMGIELAEAAVSASDRAAARRALGLDGFTVLYLARLAPEKGPDLAIEALRLVPDASLLVAGDGPERHALAEQARGLPIRFFGEARGARKRELLAAADALIVPSRQDGAPTVLLEALAAGLPIVATRVGGIPELVTPDATALLCDPDPASLAAALTRLKNAPALAAALSARARAAAAPHDWSRVAPTLFRGGGHHRPWNHPKSLIDSGILSKRSAGSHSFPEQLDDVVDSPCNPSDLRGRWCPLEVVRI